AGLAGGHEAVDRQDEEDESCRLPVACCRWLDSAWPPCGCDRAEDHDEYRPAPVDVRDGEQRHDRGGNQCACRYCDGQPRGEIEPAYGFEPPDAEADQRQGEVCSEGENVRHGARW